MKIAIIGYGKMGKTIEQIALQKGHTIVLKTSGKSSLEKIIEADVAIDFSTPKAAASNIKFCLEHQIPIVCGTTGWLDNYDEIINFCNKCNGAFIYASNFSIGVNIFFKMNEYLANLMKPWKEYQVSLEEIHHTEKLDTPSGTAITLAEDIIKNYGADSVRLFILSDSPPEKDVQWSDQGMIASFKFIQKLPY